VEEKTGDSGGRDFRGARRARSRWLWWSLFAVVLVALGVWVLVERGPDYLARYIMRTYFAGLDIDTSGIETLDIDPMRQTVSFGPVSFGGGGAEAGQVGRLSVRFDVLGLFSRRAVLSDVVIEGIRIEIHQQADGQFFLNGIPLSRILQERATSKAGTSSPEARPSTGASGAWQAGLDTLNLRDSRLVLIGRRGGRATVQVDTLQLVGFRSWAPDEPGTFRLEGDLNGIRIVTAGTATPFAGNIAFSGEVSISGIEIARIEKTFGPLGFASRAGTLAVTVRSSGASLFADGRIEAMLEGVVNASGIDLAHPDMGAAKLTDGSLDLTQGRLQQDTAGSINFQGNIDAHFDGGDFHFPDGNTMSFGSMGLRLPDLATVIPAHGTPSIAGSPRLTAAMLSVDGPDLQGTIGRLEATLGNLGLDAERQGFVVSGPIEVWEMALTVPDSEPVSINAEKARLELTEAAFQFGGGLTRIELPLLLAAADMRVTIPDIPPQPGQNVPTLTVDAAEFRGRLSPLLVEYSSATGTAITVQAPTLEARRFRFSNPEDRTTDMVVSSEAPRFRDVRVEVIVGKMLRVAGEAMLDAPALGVATGRSGPAPSDGPQALLRDPVLEHMEFAYEQNRHSPKPQKRRSFTLNAQVNMPQAKARLPASPGRDAIAADLDRLRIDLGELRWEQNPRTKDWKVALDLDLRKARATIEGGEMPATAELGDLAIAGLLMSSRPAYALERLVLGEFRSSITRRPGRGVVAPSSSASATVGNNETGKIDKTVIWPPEGLPDVRIGRISMPNGGTVTVRDETVQPPFVSTLQVQQLSLNHVDSTRPDERATMRLRASLDNGRGDINVDGWATAFRPKPDFDLQARVSSLALPVLSPLLAPHIGLGIIEGHLDASATGTAEQGRLKGDARATITDLAFVDQPQAGGDPFVKAIGVPLNTLIDLLQNADGTIDLKVPFEGDLLSPDFDFSQVIWTGILRVLRALVVAPFKLISASAELISARSSSAGAAKAQANESGLPTLAPLLFSPGAAVLDPSADESVRTFRHVLNERPRLRITVCGVAVGQDLEAVAGGTAAGPRPEVQAAAAPRLRRLAEDRTLASINALVGSGGAAADQLRRCPEPRVLTAEDGLPRADLTF
jgi:hypothetical protein